MKVKVLSLFDGISCGRVALERAGFEVEKYVAFEIDKKAIEISSANYPDIIHEGDVFNGDYTRYKGFDILMGGSPCTYWSIARQGREKTSDGMGFELFRQYVRALYESGCKYFLYENNNSIHKDIKAEISKVLGVEPITINSALVSAQRRVREYWTNIPGVTVPEDRNLLLKNIMEMEVSSRYYVSDRLYNYLTDDRDHNGYVRSKRFRPLTPNSKSYCLTTREGGTAISTYIIGNYGNHGLRRLTPLECERLQTLPDNYTSAVADTHRFKALGNGWTVDVIAHILGFIP